MEEQYSCLAECYDLLSSADYRGYSSFIAELFRETAYPTALWSSTLPAGPAALPFPCRKWDTI